MSRVYLCNLYFLLRHSDPDTVLYYRHHYTLYKGVPKIFLIEVSETEGELILEKIHFKKQILIKTGSRETARQSKEKQFSFGRKSAIFKFKLLSKIQFQQKIVSSLFIVNHSCHYDFYIW